MKYDAKNYAQAFAALESKTDLIKKLFSVMRKNGDLSQSIKTVKEVEKLHVKKIGGHLIEVEFARAQDSKTREKVLSQFGKHDRVITRVMPDLVAGARITTDGEYELDMSLSGRLEKLFA